MEIISILAKHISLEAQLFYSFTKSNSLVTYGPGFAYSITGLKHTYDASGSSLLSIILPFFSILGWLAGYLYFFDISNQLNGIEEDRLNKPDRPLPSGQVTTRGAQLRCGIFTTLFVLTGAVHHPLLVPNLVWVTASVALNCTRYGKHWAIKNIFGVSLGTWSLIIGPARLAETPTPEIERQALFVAFWAGLVILAQDWRDLEGDLKVGRNTLPIAFGDAGSRWLFVLIVEPIALGMLWLGGILEIAPLLLIAIHAVIGYRILRASGCHDKHYDAKTYTLLVYSFIVMLLVFSLYNL